MIKVLVTMVSTVLVVGLPLDAVARGHGGGGYYGGGGGHRSSGGSSYHPRAARANSYHAPQVRSPQVREHHVSHFPKSKPSRAQPHSRPTNNYREYRKEVDRVTAHNFRKNRASIDPGHTRGRRGGNDLDHRTPVKQCFDRGMSAGMATG